MFSIADLRFFLSHCRHISHFFFVFFSASTFNPFRTVPTEAGNVAQEVLRAQTWFHWFPSSQEKREAQGQSKGVP